MRRVATVVRVMAAIGGTLLGLIMILITVNVIARYFFHYDIIGVLEITEWSLLVITMLTAPWVLQLDKHVRVDIITNIVGSKSPKARYIMALISESLGALICAVVTYESLMVTITQYSQHKVSMSFLSIPMGPLYMFIALCFLFLTLIFAFRVTVMVRSRKVLTGAVDMESSV